MNKFAFVHIPKTGGTTIVNNLKKVYNVFHYDDNYRPPDIEKYDIFFGHFLPRVYKDYPLVTWLREPVSRIISHYNHLQRRIEKGNNRIMVYPATVVKFHRDMSLIDFAESVGSIYPIYVDNNIEQFKYIGILEKMDESFFELNKKFGLEQQKIVKSFRKSEKSVVPSMEEYKKLDEILKDDKRIYEYITKGGF